MKRKPVVFYTIADSKNHGYYETLKKSFKHFHPDIDLIRYGDKELEPLLKKDNHFFYRATPHFAKELIEKYELVVKIDADSLVLGDLDYILTSEYEVGTVLNWNRVDPKTFGEIGLLTIPPQMYFNNGLVAMRSKRFIDNWYNLCQSYHFEGMPYREQGFLNILTHYSDYKTRCFDYPDETNDVWNWYGLISKGEWIRATVKDGSVIVPEGEDGFPKHDMTIKAIHWGEGETPNKMNYKTRFREDVVNYIDNILYK